MAETTNLVGETAVNLEVVEKAIALLPLETLDALAAGPIQGAEDCTACRVLSACAGGAEREDQRVAANWLYRWHDDGVKSLRAEHVKGVLDLQSDHPEACEALTEDLAGDGILPINAHHERMVGEISYYRCILIYLLAKQYRDLFAATKEPQEAGE